MHEGFSHPYSLKEFHGRCDESKPSCAVYALKVRAFTEHMLRVVNPPALLIPESTAEAAIDYDGPMEGCAECVEFDEQLWAYRLKGVTFGPPTAT